MPAATPFFSIIVPTYRRPARLAACLEAMTHLDYPANRLEVIVVDDGSDAPPEATITAVRDRLDATLLTPSHGGPAAARNVGAARAKGDVLAFTDDDCAPAPAWLRSFAARLGPGCAVGGRTLNALPENLYSTASQLLIDYLYAYYNADTDHARFFTSNNVAVPADRFRELGGFDVTFRLPAAEDRDFCARWLHRGHRLAYAPEAVIRHAHELTLRRFWRQHFGYGRGAFHFHRMHAARSRDRLRVEPPAFYWGLLNHPLRRAPRRRALPLTALTVLSQIANALGFLAERRAAAGAS